MTRRSCSTGSRWTQHCVNENKTRDVQNDDDKHQQQSAAAKETVSFIRPAAAANYDLSPSAVEAAATTCSQQSCSTLVAAASSGLCGPVSSCCGVRAVSVFNHHLLSPGLIYTSRCSSVGSMEGRLALLCCCTWQWKPVEAACLRCRVLLCCQVLHRLQLLAMAASSALNHSCFCSCFACIGCILASAVDAYAARFVPSLWLLSAACVQCWQVVVRMVHVTSVQCCLGSCLSQSLQQFDFL